MIEPHVYQAISEVVGEDFISDDPVVRQTYSKDGGFPAIMRRYQKDPTAIPDLVVLPASTEEVQRVVRIANRYGLKVIPISTGANMVSLAIPVQLETIALDLKRMDKILDIDERNMTATIQPYVSFARIQSATMKRGLWNGGAPLAPGSCGLLANIINSGTWQSSLAYGVGLRSLANLTLVLPNGEILRTGSATMPACGNFWCQGPGPDLKGIFEFTNHGGMAVITEVTVKLHAWAGGEWPQEEIYDRPPLPANHRIYYVEFSDIESMNEAFYEIAHSGIGTHLNGASNGWVTSMTQRTEELAEQKWREGFFPRHMMYVITAGISSPRQLEYEENVLKDIVEETGGWFREDLREEMSTWHGDAFVDGCGSRFQRHGSFSSIKLGCGTIDNHREFYERSMQIVNRHPHYMFDEETPYVYIFERGYYALFEDDTVFDQSDYEEVKQARDMNIDGFIRTPKEDQLDLGYYYMEPVLTIFSPVVGPNAKHWVSQIKKVFDPKDTMNPGKLVRPEPTKAE
ncbi:FAD-binding oxidoreductase [Chloroflexota bacterium]